MAVPENKVQLGVMLSLLTNILNKTLLALKIAAGKGTLKY